MEPASLTITSPAFENDGIIPVKYTCDGEEINPELRIERLPEGTQYLALIVEDPDAPRGVYDHWVVWNIPSHTRIKENSSPGISGHNSAGKTGYHGPCPPSGSHRYIFSVFALDAALDLPVGSNKSKLLQEWNPIFSPEAQSLASTKESSNNGGGSNKCIARHTISCLNFVKYIAT
jgi:Raf kinase inhibitor-like YbhB/YbcL family protein